MSGHEDWVRSLDFCLSVENVDDQPLTLASGSQDGTIRLWTITPAPVNQEVPSDSDVLDDQLLDAFEATLTDMNNDEHGKQVSMKQHLIKLQDQAGLVSIIDCRMLLISSGHSTYQFHITFDALLIGHDAGVTSVSWKPSTPRILLSTSTDSSAILWSPTTLGQGSSHSNQLWTNHQRFGDVGGQRLGGFVGGFWLNAEQIITCAWNGGSRRWGMINGQWSELQAVTGHASAVHGIDWEPFGRYLVSARYSAAMKCMLIFSNTSLASIRP